MREYNQSGNWPANSIADTREMRNSLRDNLYDDADFVLVAHNKIIRTLECIIPRTSESYLDFLLRQGILYNIIIDNSLDETEGYIYATNKGMPITHDVDCLRVIPRNSFTEFKFTQMEEY